MLTQQCWDCTVSATWTTRHLSFEFSFRFLSTCEAAFSSETTRNVFVVLSLAQPFFQHLTANKFWGTSRSFFNNYWVITRAISAVHRVLVLSEVLSQNFWPYYCRYYCRFIENVDSKSWSSRLEQTLIRVARQLLVLSKLNLSCKSTKLTRLNRVIINWVASNHFNLRLENKLFFVIRDNGNVRISNLWTLEKLVRTNSTAPGVHINVSGMYQIEKCTKM